MRKSNNQWTLVYSIYLPPTNRNQSSTQSQYQIGLKLSKNISNTNSSLVLKKKEKTDAKISSIKWSPCFDSRCLQQHLALHKFPKNNVKKGWKSLKLWRFRGLLLKVRTISWITLIHDGMTFPLCLVAWY